MKTSSYKSIREFYKKDNIVPTYNTGNVISNNPTKIPFNIPQDTEPLKKEKSELNIKVEVKKFANSNSPMVWGPSFWFTLHNSASGYPVNPTSYVIERMKGVILAIPILLRCEVCKEHATTYIEKYVDKLDEICGSRDSLFKFFVDFHNAVNIRHDKPVLSYDEAYKLYNSDTVNIITYH
jgi:hypothetical protein